MKRSKKQDSFVAMMPEEVISVERARAFLGADYDSMDDDAIRSLILHLDGLAKLILEVHRVQKTKLDGIC